MQLTIETTMLTALGSCSGAILCLLHCAAAGEAPALAGVAAFDADIQLHAVKLCSPLESKPRHRLLQQECINHTLNPCSSVLRAGVASAPKPEARVPDLGQYSS